jgi:hypothetical protein
VNKFYFLPFSNQFYSFSFEINKIKDFVNSFKKIVQVKNIGIRKKPTIENIKLIARLEYPKEIILINIVVSFEQNAN